MFSGGRIRTSLAHKCFNFARNIADITGVELFGGGGVGGLDVRKFENEYPGVEGEESVVDAVGVR
jgi:hypothetical protein